VLSQVDQIHWLEQGRAIREPSLKLEGLLEHLIQKIKEVRGLIMPFYYLVVNTQLAGVLRGCTHLKSSLERVKIKF